MKMEGEMKAKIFYFGIFFSFILIFTIFSCQTGLANLQEVKCYIEEEKFEEALSELNKIIRTNPDSGEAHLLLGQIYEKKAKLFLDKAIEEYKKALQDEKVNLTARKNLARLLLERGEYDKVVTFLSEVKEEEKDFELLKLLGFAYFKQGRLTEALERLEKARSLNPNDTEVLLSLAQIYEDKKLFDEAIASYEKIVSLGKEKFTKIAKRRIELIKQQRKSLTIEDIKDPEIKRIILTAPEAKDFPEAGAAILLNEYECLVKKNNTMVEKIHKIIKIFNVRGREKYGEVQIDYDSTYQTVKIDYARTIKPDGSIIEVGKKDIKDIDRWTGFPLYSNAKVKIISMPEVVEDSIIEYKATIFTAKLINEDDFQFRFPLQYFEPCLHHKLKLKVPKDRKINIHYVRIKGKEPKISQNGDFLVYEWEINNIPEIIPEPNMPPWADISPFIMVSSFESWDEFSNWWRNLSKGQAEPTAEIEKKVKEIIKGKITQREKAEAIYHWIVSNIRYVGLEFGVAGFKPHSAEEIFNNKYGDCKDKATLLIAMYKVVKIPAYYALIGTREMGKLEKEIPMSQFNHAICLAEIEGEKIFLDPTAETASFGEIPGGDQEKLALVFFPDEAKFMKVPLKPPEENKLVTEMEIKIYKDASIKANIEITTSGATDMEFRSFKYIKPARRKQIIENWINSLAPGAKLIDYRFSDLEDYETPVKLNVVFFAPDYLKKAGDVYLFTIPGIQLETGEVGKEKRKYPIVFSTTSLMVDKVKVYLPKEFEIKFIPEDIHLELPYLSFISDYEIKDGTILYEGIFKRDTTKITTSQYPEYKLFRERISRESQRQILIKAKE